MPTPGIESVLSLERSFHEIYGAAAFRTAERLEWWTLYLLAADDNGIVSKEKIRANYDGSLWYLVADELEAKKQAKLKVEKAKLM